MKICFISGQKESKQCGITDYVELLAQGLEKLGHQTELYFINKDCEVLNDLPDADLYSIQFAPYAFATNGLPNQILKCLARKLQYKKVHLNFHEIWVGAYPNANWKERGIGWFQKNQILGFIRNCKPASITSSNAAAIDRLKRRGILVRFLYIFGNIPYFPTSKLTTTVQTLKIAFFGTNYADFPYDNLGDFFSNLSKTCDKQLEIILIGRQREDGGTDQLLALCKKYNFLIKMSGELSSNLISEHLQRCALGVSTTPYDVIGKSGATAAMLEHGLPVLAYDDGDTPQENLFIPDPFQNQIFLINEDTSLEKLLQCIKKPRKCFFDGVAHTAKKMLEIIS